MATATKVAITTALLACVLCPDMKDGKPVMKEGKGKDAKPEPVLRPVKVSEVFDYAIHGNVVTVVTKQGRKYSGEIPKNYKGPELGEPDPKES